MSEPLPVSGLLRYQFRQSVRLQAWLHARDKTTGYPQADCDRALAALPTDLDTGAVVLVTAEWADVHASIVPRAQSLAGCSEMGALQARHRRRDLELAGRFCAE